MDAYVNPDDMERQVLGLVRKYNVMEYAQICAFFPGKEKAAGRAVKKLIRMRQIYQNPHTRLIAASEYAYSLKEEGTIRCLWVLIDILRKRRVDGNYLAQKEDFPARILMFSGEEIFDILYVAAGDVKLVNGIFLRGRKPGCHRIVVVEDGVLIGQLRIPEVIGYCVVREGGAVGYYRRAHEEGRGNTARGTG